MKGKKVTAKGLFLTLAPADPLFFRIVYPKAFPVCALVVSLFKKNVVIITPKLFEKT